MLTVYSTKVSHRRYIKPLHRLSYKVQHFWFSLTKIDDVNHLLRLTPFSFKADDFSDVETIRSLAMRATIKADGEITVLAMPRMFGLGFNPISVYFVTNKFTKEPVAVIYQVRNTFGDQHFYSAPLPYNGEMEQHECSKRFHVSPFLDNDGIYQFALHHKADAFKLGITKAGQNGPELFAKMSSEPIKFSALRAWLSVLSMPFQGIGVLGAIHWEAMKLWLKGAPVFTYTGKLKKVREQTQPQILLPIRQRNILWSFLSR